MCVYEKVRAVEFEPSSFVSSSLGREGFVCVGSGAAAENHYSNVVPTVQPRSQISDKTIIASGTIFALSYANSNLPGITVPGL